jgi:acetolactate synthase-1/3 small subunit
MDRYVISVLVRNHSGVLSRISGLFSRRGYNIDSLTVGVTENPEVSRMTIAVNGDRFVLEQITKQLDKLIDVIHIEELVSGDAIYRELILLKVTAGQQLRAPIIELADIFRAKIIDVASESISMEVTGDQSKLNAFIELLQPYGIREMVRTGLTGLGRGNATILDCIPQE